MTPVPAAAAQARGSCLSGVAVRRHGQDSTTFAARPPAAAAAQECRTFTRAVAREAGADFFQKIYTSIFFLKKTVYQSKAEAEARLCTHAHIQTHRHTDASHIHTYTQAEAEARMLARKMQLRSNFAFFFGALTFFLTLFFFSPRHRPRLKRDFVRKLQSRRNKPRRRHVRWRPVRRSSELPPLVRLLEPTCRWCVCVFLWVGALVGGWVGGWVVGW